MSRPSGSASSWRHNTMAFVTIAPLTPEIVSRVLGLIDAKGVDECWPWTGRTIGHGRGQFYCRVDGKPRLALASHYVLAMDGRPRPDGLNALHSCDNPNCCNPRHLSWGTQKANVAQAMSRGRHQRGEASGRARLTEAEVLAIRADERGCRRLAREYGVGVQTIVGIRAGKTWRHLLPNIS